jgi:hypothetical protein
MTADAGLPAVAPESEADVARAELERASSRDAALRTRARRVIPGGMYGHQSDNWFLSAAHAGADVDLALERTDAAFAAVRSRFGPDAAVEGEA